MDTPEFLDIEQEFEVSCLFFCDGGNESSAKRWQG